MQISAQLKAKVDAAKEYIEGKYSKIMQAEKRKSENWEMFEQKIQDFRLTEDQKHKIRNEIMLQES